ncbi:hypothetical protein [Alteriqipengyuania sp.]|uniref:hypothetical protein n=1 Tax=Alteriqipengyuania sp. TaxID=2800692 RepID=UPI003511FCF8
MSLFDSILKQTGGAPDDVVNLAKKVGIDPAMAEKAIAALGQAHPKEGDTVELAAGKTGIDAGTLGQIVQQIGGEGSLGEYARQLQEHPQAAGVLKMLDSDGDGDVIDDITGMAGKFFGKK